MKFFLNALTLLFLLSAACTRSTVVQSRYVIQTDTTESECSYEWQRGDYWEFLAWALLDDVSASSVLAITAGYAPDVLPSPGTEIRIPIPEEFEQAASDRMKAARLVRSATDIRETDRDDCMDLLEEAMDTDPSWSVPVTNITVLLIEDGKTDEALVMLQPMSYKNTPALVLAGLAWSQGSTESALRHLSEALTSSSPRPEVLAAAGIAWSVTGDRERAGNIIRQLLENPDAPSDLRVLALKYALMLGKD